MVVKPVLRIIIVPCEWLRGKAASNRDQIRGRGGLWVDTEERPRATKSVGHGLVNLRPTFGQNTPETSEERQSRLNLTGDVDL